MKSQIITLGGGNLSGSMKDYLLSLFETKPKVCFIPTASGNSKFAIADFYKFFPHNSTHITFSKKGSFKRYRKKLLKQDVIFVGGGNTIYLIAILKKYKIDEILKEAYDKGIVLCGVSAGMNCWFEEFATDSLVEGYIAPFKKGLGFLRGSSCPHYDAPVYRRAFNYFIKKGILNSGFGADGGVALHFIDGKLENVVSSEYRAKGYSVTKEEEKTLITRFIGRYRNFV